MDGGFGMTSIEMEAAICIGVVVIAFIASCIYLAYLIGIDEGRRSADPPVPEIKRLDLQDGDLLVIRTQHPVSSAQAKRIKGQIEQFAPGYKCAVLDGLQLDVISSQSDVRGGFLYGSGTSTQRMTFFSPRLKNVPPR
jgi:hypothetical protein